ncbi:MAG: hypothetical protein DYH06_06515 [Acidobacteria bacterium ACB2]|nr:hypothetical protein [Acidobacteria bacterium ACB2]
MTGAGRASWRVGGLPRTFTKMSGAGNDFLVFGRKLPVGPREAETIRRLCRRGTGIGADGVLFVSRRERGAKLVVDLDYFNADGGPARFCANGTRCAARFAARAAGAEGPLTVRTGWGEIPAQVREDGNVTLSLPEPIALDREVPTFDPAGRVLEPSAAFLTVGVPHLVVFAAEGVEVETLDVASLGPPLSVVAAAVVSGLSRGRTPPVSVATRSGSALVVDFRVEGSLARDVSLTGDARFVFEGTLTEEAL